MRVTAFIALPAITAWVMSTPPRTIAADVPEFATTARQKWVEYERTVAALSLQWKVERYRTVTPAGKPEEWQRTTIEMKQRAGHVYWYVEDTDVASPKPTIECRVANPKYAFVVRKNDPAKGWFLRQTVPGGEGGPDRDQIAGLPTEEQVRQNLLAGLKVNGTSASLFLPDLLADKTVRSKATTEGDDIVWDFQFPPSDKPRKQDTPFVRGTIRLDPTTYLIRSYTVTTDAEHMGKLERKANHTPEVFKGVTLTKLVEERFSGYDTHNKTDVTGGQTLKYTYTSREPAESEFELRAFELGTVGKKMEEELPPAPPPRPWFLLPIVLGVVCVAAGFVVFRLRSRSKSATG
ncbi:MAG: hypothetical protein ABGY75_01090 [Gemmataceae bacterium]